MGKEKSSNRFKLRIIGGDLRRSRLDFVDVPGLRPTPDRIRETLFNWLQDSIAGASCLDLFAGSGALGFEALSRGVDELVFVEKNPKASKAIEGNISRLKIANARVMSEDARDSVMRFQLQKKKFDIVFLDPPFSEGLIPSICEQLEGSGILQNGAKIYIETGEAIVQSNLPQSWVPLKEKKAGAVNYHLLTKTN